MALGTENAAKRSDDGKQRRKGFTTKDTKEDGFEH